MRVDWVSFARTCLAGVVLALATTLPTAPHVLASTPPQEAVTATLHLAPTTISPTAAAVTSPTGTPTVTPSPSPTPTATPTATPLPPTPTVARPTPQPSGYFVSVYRGQIEAPGLGSSLIRGRVVDYQGFGIASFPVAVTTSGVSYSTAAGPDGSYAIGGLKPGIYSVTTPGYSGIPAEGVFVPASTVVSVDFVEAARPGTVAEAEPTPEPESARLGEVSIRGRPSIVIVVLTPEGGAVTDAIRPTPTPTPKPTAESSWALPPLDSWAQAFLIGMGASYALAILGLVVAGLRR